MPESSVPTVSAAILPFPRLPPSAVLTDSDHTEPVTDDSVPTSLNTHCPGPWNPREACQGELMTWGAVQLHFPVS
jgi:hypothetical protein